MPTTKTRTRPMQQQQGLPHQNTASYVPSTQDVKKNFEQLLNKPPPKFQALSTQGSSQARRLRQEQSIMRKKSSMGASAAGGKTNAGNSGARSATNENGAFDYEKLKQAMNYASQFEYTVDEDAMASEERNGSSSSSSSRNGHGGSSNSGHGNGSNGNGSNGGGKGSGGKGRNGRRRSKGKSAAPIKNDSLRDRYGKSSTSSPSSRKNVVAKKQQHSNKNNGRYTWQEADRSKRTSGGGGGGSKSNAMSRSDLKVAELTANFQQGTELQRLRNELEQSKASLNQSNQFIDHAKGWFKK